MRSRRLFCVLLAWSLANGGIITPIVAVDKTSKQAKLEAKAKIPKADAERIALGRVKDGNIIHGDLEKERGKLVWSFDIATPGTKNITEVQLNAKTGKVVKVETETPADEAKEQKKENKKTK